MILSVEKPETEVLCFRKENSHCQNYNHRFSVDLDACDLGSGLYKNENQMCQELCYLEQLRRNTLILGHAYLLETIKFESLGFGLVHFLFFFPLKNVY